MSRNSPGPTTEILYLTNFPVDSGNLCIGWTGPALKQTVLTETAQ